MMHEDDCEMSITKPGKETRELTVHGVKQTKEEMIGGKGVF